MIMIRTVLLEKCSCVKPNLVTCNLTGIKIKTTHIGYNQLLFFNNNYSSCKVELLSSLTPANMSTLHPT